MGLFGLFKKKQEEEQVKFENIDSWMKSYLDRKDLGASILGFKRRMRTIIDEIKEALAKLEEANLLNENIPQRAKNILEGNRKNYVQKINQFLNELNVPSDYMQIRKFSRQLTEKIDELSKETQKSYFVLKEFLESDLAAVAKKVKELENRAIKFRQEIEKEKLERLEDIKEKMNEFHESEKTIQHLKKEEDLKKESIKELKDKKKVIEAKINKLKNDKSYKEYEELNSKKEKLAKKVQAQKVKILSHFSTLEKALRKYKRNSLNEELIDKYLEEPSNALLDDENLEIINLLQKMKDSLEKLGLKDKKLEKTKEEIDMLDKELLTKLKVDLKMSIDKEKDNKNRLLSNTSSLNISEQMTWLENVDNKIKERESEIEDIENKIERLNPKLIKQKIRDSLKEFNVILNG